MNKKGFAPLIATIIIALIVGAGAGFVTYESLKIHKGPKPIPPSSTIQSLPTTTIPKTTTTITSVTSSENKLPPKEFSRRLLECKNIHNIFAKNNCYGNLAIDANDPSLCQSFGSAICKYLVFMWNTNLCSNIPIHKPIYSDNVNLKDLDKKEECIKKFAIETKNIELCKKLFTGMNDCQDTIAIELNDPSKCGSNDCIMNFAISKKDINLCINRFSESKDWCIVEFPRLLRGTPTGQQYNKSCFRIRPIGIEDSGLYKLKNKYMYPNAYDNGENDYLQEIAPKSALYHLLSIPFNKSKKVLRVYKNKHGDIQFLRLVEYSFRDKKSKIIGDIVVQSGSNWGGIYIPIALSKNDDYILFKGHMGDPGAGGGSVNLGYAYLSLSSPRYDDCGYLNSKTISGGNVYFYDNFSKALFYSEEDNVPHSERPGPYYNSSIKSIDIGTGITKTLLKEPNTIYEIINIDEKSDIVKFKSCPWREFTFNCPTLDKSTRIRSLRLP